MTSAIMELGQYRFLEEQGCLEDGVTGERKLLQRNELLVLSQLMLHRGQTLSKQRLSCGGGKTPIIRESAVVKAVCTLRQTLGEPEASYIHTVPKEGYQLVLMEPPLDVEEEASPWPHPTAKECRPGLLVWRLAVIGILLALLVAAAVSQIPSSPLSSSRSEIANGHGQKMAVTIITSSQSNLREMSSYTESLTSHLAGCVYFPWDEIHLALSHDRQMLNVTLIRQGAEGRIRNIKISDFRAHPKFIDPQWLQREFECE